jgi:hypothetical protein
MPLNWDSSALLARVNVRCGRGWPGRSSLPRRSGGQPSRGSLKPPQGYYGGQGGHGHQT